MRHPPLGMRGTDGTALETSPQTVLPHQSEERPPATVARKSPLPNRLGARSSTTYSVRRRARSGSLLIMRWVLVGTILGSSIVFIDMTVVNVALPSIQSELGGGLAAQQWVVDAYLLTLGSLILVGGSLGDIFGEVRMFTLGTAAFGVASVLCAVAPTINALIVFRGIQGVAGALLTPASLAVITSSFSGADRGAAIGTWTAWSGISTVIGPVVGGWLIGIASWRVIFFINVPIAAATVAIALIFMPQHGRSRKKDTPIDYVGATLCALGLGGIVFALIEQPQRGWTDAAVAAGPPAARGEGRRGAGGPAGRRRLSGRVHRGGGARKGADPPAPSFREPQ